METYSLDSGEELNQLYPDSFHLPPRACRYGLVPGAIVKLVFRINTPEGVEVERMWVGVKSVADGRYLGALDNDPFCDTPLKAGDEIHFGPEHVIDIHDSPA